MKRTFKDFFKQDIERVFFNKDEFAETVIINGESMDIVYNTDTIIEKDTAKKLATCDVVFYTAASNFEYLPQPELYMVFEGEKYKIEVAHNHGGLLTIGLSRNYA